MSSGTGEIQLAIGLSVLLDQLQNMTFVDWRYVWGRHKYACSGRGGSMWQGNAKNMTAHQGRVSAPPFTGKEWAAQGSSVLFPHRLESTLCSSASRNHQMAVAVNNRSAVWAVVKMTPADTTNVALYVLCSWRQNKLAAASSYVTCAATHKVQFRPISWWEIETRSVGRIGKKLMSHDASIKTPCFCGKVVWMKYST